MKLACQEHLVPGLSLAQKLDWLEQHGFAGVELWAFDIRERVQEIIATHSASSIKITSLCGGYDGYLFHPSAEERTKAIQGVQDLIRYASEIGAGGVVIVPAFGLSRSPGVLTPHPRATADEIEQFGETLAILSDTAKTHGVKVFAEVINRYESHAFNRIDEVATAIRQANAEHVSLLIDSFHMNIEEASIPAVIEANHSLIGYVHVSDSNRRAPGQGHFSFGEMVQALQKVNYDGYYTLECFISDEQDLLKAKRHLLQYAN